MEKISLRPNHDLLDSDFEGYKLSLDPLPCYEGNLDGRTLSTRKLDHEQYSLMHVKLFGRNNVLVFDPFDEKAVYLIDNEKEAVLQVLDRADENRAPDIIQVWSSAADGATRPGDYNPSLSFPDRFLAIFSDGRGSLYILKTGKRPKGGQKWTTVFHSQVCGLNCPFIVSSSRMVDKSLQVLLNHVEEASKVENLKKSYDDVNYVNVVEWLTLKDEGSGANWSLDQVKKFAFKGTSDMLEMADDGFYCLTEKTFEMFYNSSGMPDLEEVAKDDPLVQREGRPPPFYWYQGVEDMVIWVDLPKDATKRDIKVSLKPSEVEMRFRDKVLFGGKLWHILDRDTMTWTITKGRLEITVAKAKEGIVWQRFLKQDETIEDGLEIGRPKDLDDAINQFNVGQDVEMIYNGQELESCDDAPEEPFSFYLVKGEDGKPSHGVSIGGRERICNIPGTDCSSTRLCLRHDVDGLVWQPSTRGDNFAMDHVGTFGALGYVQASKQQRKFTVCSPDLSFAAICDFSRHIYLYHQPTSISSGCQLRNRRSGQQVEKVAKQQVITLRENSDEIIGAVATRNTLFIATTNHVFALVIQ